jgi:hypothetical protein
MIGEKTIQVLLLVTCVIGSLSCIYMRVMQIEKAEIRRVEESICGNYTNEVGRGLW